MSRVKIKHGMIEAEVDEEEEEYIQTGSKSASAPIPHQHMKQRQVMTVLEPLEEADGRLGRFCEGTVLLGYSTRCTILHDIVRIQHTTARPTNYIVSSGWIGPPRVQQRYGPSWYSNILQIHRYT